MSSKSITAVVLALGSILFFSFQKRSSSRSLPANAGMFKVTILYPNGSGKTFDMDYYSRKHMPLVAALLGDSLKRYEIDKGISGRTSNDSIPFLAIGYLYFDRLSAYQQSFKQHAERIRNDIPNYTNIQPVIQISEVIK